MVIWALYAAVASAATVDLDLDTRTINVGQSVFLRVTVNDGSPTSIPKVRAPDGVVITYEGSRQSSSWLIEASGQRKSQRRVEYTFRVAPSGEGVFELGPALVEMGVDTVATSPIQLTVEAPTAGTPQAISADAGFDASHAWEGEVVIYHYTLKARDQILRAAWAIPEWEGLVPPRDGDRPELRYSIDDPQGTINVSDTLVPLVATSPGLHKYEGAVVQVTLPAKGKDTPRPRDPFGLMFGAQASREEVVATPPTTLNIEALPSPAPPGFSGLVGDFTMQSAIDKAQLPVGGSITWTIALKGDGSLEGFSLPKSKMPDSVRVYDGSQLVDATMADREYLAKGYFSRVIVPVQTGTLQLPPIDIVTFSPSKGEYVTLRAEASPIEVVAGTATDADLASFRSDEPVALTPPDDIHGAVRGLDRWPRWAGWAPAGLGLIAAPGAGAFVWEWVAAWRRRREAAKRPIVVLPSARLRQLPADAAGRFAALDAALRESLARAAKVPLAALDRDAATTALAEELAAEVRAVTQQLDRTRFGGNSPSADLEARIMALVTQLERL